MEDKKYNGWTNYETWNVKLWMDNDAGTYNYYKELTDNATDIYSLSEQIKEEFEENNPLNDLPASTYTDLLDAALSEVNWYEIAESLWNDNNRMQEEE